MELSYDGLELEVPLTLDPEVPLLELQDASISPGRRHAASGVPVLLGRVFG